MLVKGWRLIYVVMVGIGSLTDTDLVIGQCCKGTDQLYWRPEPPIRTDKVSLVEIKVERHVLSVVGIEILNVFFKFRVILGWIKETMQTAVVRADIFTILVYLST